MAADEKSANQFISALVKNLQAVCHGHVEFDQNVKVVGHLYLTVDSNTEFNYIVNEKVSKSDESSTTFVSKSFYATDPQQKTPKKNPERPFPSPTPNVLGKTRFDISVDLTDDQPQSGAGRYQQMAQQRGQFSHPRGGFAMQRPPQMRRRPFDPRGSSQMAKMPRLSSPMRHPMNLPSGSPRRMPTAVPQRLPAPSSVIPPSISSETKTDITSPSSIPPESVSGTPAQSLPGADKPETEQGKEGEKNTADSEKDVKFEVIKVENGNVVASDKDKGEAELRIESVTSHDLSLNESESTSDKEAESKSSETSDSDKPSSDPPPETAPSAAPETSSAASSSKTKKQNEPEVIEIDLTKVKDEIDSVLDSSESTNFMFDSGNQRHQSIAGAQGGDSSLSSFGGESNDDEFFASLREQTVGLYPVGLHANESNNAAQNFMGSDIPNLSGVQGQGGAYVPVAGSSTGTPQNNQQIYIDIAAPPSTSPCTGQHLLQVTLLSSLPPNLEQKKKKTRAEKQKEYRNRIKNDPVAYEIYRKKEAERATKNRQALIQKREMSKERSRRNKQQMKASEKNGNDKQSGKKLTRSEKKKTQTEKWREQKRRQRLKMTSQQKSSANEKRRALYAAKKKKPT